MVSAPSSFLVVEKRRGADGGSSEAPSRWDSGRFRRITETDSPVDGMKRPNGRPALEGKPQEVPARRHGIASKGRETRFGSSSIAISGTRHPNRSTFFGFWDQLRSVRDEWPFGSPSIPKPGSATGTLQQEFPVSCRSEASPFMSGIRRRPENPPGPWKLFSITFARRLGSAFRRLEGWLSLVV